MEAIYDEASEAVSRLAEAVERYNAVKNELVKLAEYYQGELWLKDVDDSRTGKLPGDLKCGVLSEDAVYDLLLENIDVVSELGAAVEFDI
jgi:hypothetical protein